MKERASLGLDDFKPEIKSPVNELAVTKLANSTEFASREPKKNRKREPSPFTKNKSIRIRPEMYDLLFDLGQELNIRDYNILENGILLLIKANNLTNLEEEFYRITKKEGE